MFALSMLWHWSSLLWPVNLLGSECLVITVACLDSCSVLVSSLNASFLDALCFSSLDLAIGRFQY